MNRNRLLKKTLAATLSASMLIMPSQALAENSYVTDNTETVMQNASSEGGGMVYNLEKPSEEEYAQLKEQYQELYAVPENAGETEYPAEYPRELLTPMTDEEIEPIVNALVKTMTF